MCGSCPATGFAQRIVSRSQSRSQSRSPWAFCSCSCSSSSSAVLSCPRVARLHRSALPSTNDNISGLTSPPTSIFNSTLHIQNATSRSTPALLRPLAEEDQSDNQRLRPPPSRPTVVVRLDDWLRTAAQRRRHQRTRICVWRPRPTGADGGVLDEAKDRAAGRDIPERDSARVYVCE